MTYKEWQSYKRRKRTEVRQSNVTWAKPSARRAPLRTKDKQCITAVIVPTSYARVVTRQTLESRATMQDLLEKHNFVKTGSIWA